MCRVEKDKRELKDKNRCWSEKLSEKNIHKGGGVFFRRLHVENQLGHDENGPIHGALCLQEALQSILLRVDKASDKTFRINQKNQGSDPLLNGFPVETGRIGVRKAAGP